MTNRIEGIEYDEFRPKSMTEARRSDFWQTLPQSEAEALLKSPETHIDSFELTEILEENYGIIIRGNQELGGVKYPFFASLSSPGFIERAIAKVRGREPRVSISGYGYKLPAGENEGLQF